MKHRNWTRIAPLALALALLPTLVFGGQAVVPRTFTNGAIADANHVNENFAELAAEINDNDARINELTGSRTHRVKATSDAIDNGQRLLDALDESGSGAELVLEPGTYDVGTTTIDPHDASVIRGAGRAQTVIKSQAAPAVGAPLLLPGSDITLRDLTIEHAPQEATNTVRIGRSKNFVARNVRIDSKFVETGAAIRLAGSTCTLFDVEISLAAVGTNAPSLYGIDVDFGVRTVGGLPEIVHASLSITNTIITASTTAVFHASGSTAIRNCVLRGSTAIEGAGGSSPQVACSEVDGAVVGGVQLVHCYDGDFNPL